MTKAETMKKVRELAQEVRKNIVEDVEFLLESGHIEMKTYTADSYLLPKLLVTAALLRNRFMFRPHGDPRYREIIKNLEVV